MNSRKLGLILIFISLCFANTHGQQRHWYEKALQLRVGESTKDDIERIFGKSMPVGGGLSKAACSEQGFFKTDYGRVFANYSLGDCNDGSDHVKFKKGVLRYFSIVGLRPVKLSKTKLDLTRFTTEVEGDTGNVIYSDEVRRIRYTVNRTGKLTEIHLN